MAPADRDAHESIEAASALSWRDRRRVYWADGGGQRSSGSSALRAQEGEAMLAFVLYVVRVLLAAVSIVGTLAKPF